MSALGTRASFTAASGQIQASAECTCVERAISSRSNTKPSPASTARH
jgi:hypothetical protein